MEANKSNLDITDINKADDLGIDTTNANGEDKSGISIVGKDKAKKWDISIADSNIVNNPVEDINKNLIYRKK